MIPYFSKLRLIQKIMLAGSFLQIIGAIISDDNMKCPILLQQQEIPCL